MHDWIVPPKYSQHLNFAPFVQATSDVSRKQFMVSMNCCSVLLPVLFGGRGRYFAPCPADDQEGRHHNAI